MLPVSYSRLSKCPVATALACSFQFVIIDNT